MAVYSPADIADALQDGLRNEADAFDAEQAVHGLDALDELELHPILARVLERAGFGVHREVHYPADRRRRSRSEGERCDLVLTPDGRPLRAADRDATLFDPENACAEDDALWVEVKVVHQHTTEGASSGYGGRLLSTTFADVRKLSKDRDILHAVLVIVLFAAHESVAEHDLAVWLDKAIGTGLPVSAPSIRMVPINDRMGNGVCALGVYPVAHL